MKEIDNRLIGNGPTPGNYTMLFVGGGRALLNQAAAVATIGAVVWPSALPAASFQSGGSPTAGIRTGQSVQITGAAGLALAYYSDILFRFGGF